MYIFTSPIALLFFYYLSLSSTLSPLSKGLSASEVERQRLLNATPRTAALRRAIESEIARMKKKKEFLKRDSFFFLQKTLERRSEETRRLKTSLGNRVFEDIDFPQAPTYQSSGRDGDSPRSEQGGGRLSERNL